MASAVAGQIAAAATGSFVESNGADIPRATTVRSHAGATGPRRDTCCYRGVGRARARARANVSRTSLTFLLGDSCGLSSRHSAAFTDGYGSQDLRCGLITNGRSGLRKPVLPGSRPSRRQRGGALSAQAAVFDQLTTSLEEAWAKVRKEDRLTKENIKEPLLDIRRALLEADVSLPVTRRFIKNVSEKAVGTDVVRGVRPDQQLVKVVNDELVALMGGKLEPLEFAASGPTVILLAGLQGVGKTTACGKLGITLKKKNKKVLMVATDVYRPAAIEQLITLGRQVEIPVFEMGTNAKPADIARKGLEHGKKIGVDVVIIDTAGRLQIDKNMMNELRDVKNAVKPTEILLVVDAMTGQEAAALVASFNQEVGITGAILTKIDGDSRGGAALSVKEVSGKPIKFVGEGEAMVPLEPFYPDRMASRILGMGDVLTLVEKAQEMMVKEDAEAIQKKILEANFDFNDFLKQTRMMAKMGTMGGLLKMIPGMSKVTPQQVREAEKSLRIMESMIQSMTPMERSNPDLVASSPSRRRRIAKGSGRTQEQVSGLLSQLFQMRVKMKNLASMMKGGAMPGLGEMEDMLGSRKPKPGTAKRKKRRVGGEGLTAVQGFGAAKK